MMRVLVACEESQTVCKAFRERGFEAYSCDIKPCSGGHPEWHIQDEYHPFINGGGGRLELKIIKVRNLLEAVQEDLKHLKVLQWQRQPNGETIYQQLKQGEI